MDKNLHFHLSYYLVLVLILSLGTVVFFFFSGERSMQFVVGVITSFSYFSWGVVHHHLEGDLHPAIVVEYLLIALLAVFLLRGAIYQ